MNKILRLIFLFCGAVLINGTVNAQNPSWEWAKSGTGPDNDEGNSIAVDAQGYVYALGNFSSQDITFGSTVLTNVNSNGGTWSDVFITKFDSTGNVVWAKSAGGEHNDYGRGIAIDNDNNIIITGAFMSDSITFDSITLFNHPYVTDVHDLFIAKYNSNGQVTWAKSYGAGGYEESFSVACDNSGNIYITGGLSSPSITFDTITVNQTWSANSFIAKFDTSGTAVWVKIAVGGCVEKGYGIAVDLNDNIVVSGYFSGDSITFDAITITNTGIFGTHDGFVVKFDPSGNAVWAKGIGGGSQPDQSYNLQVDHAGNVIVTGVTLCDTLQFDNIIVSIPHHNTDNIFIVKYDDNGNALWAKAAGNSGSDYVWTVETDDNDNIFLAGSFQLSLVFDNDSLTNEWHQELFVAKLDPAGNALWMKGVDSICWNEIKSIAIYGDNIYATGIYGFGMIGFDSTILVNYGDNDVFVAKINQGIQSTGMQEVNTPGTFNIFPNPAQNTITIDKSLMTGKDTPICITNQFGQIVYTNNIIQDAVIDISFLKPGIYFLRAGPASNLFVKKFSVFSK